MSVKTRLSGTLTLTILMAIGFTVNGANEIGNLDIVAAQDDAAADGKDNHLSARPTDDLFDGIDRLTANLCDVSGTRELLRQTVEVGVASSVSDDDLFVVTAPGIDCWIEQPVVEQQAASLVYVSSDREEAAWFISDLSWDSMADAK